MSRSNFKQDVLQDASAGIARSIVEIGEIQSDIKFTEPLAANRLVKQTKRLKMALKDVEKLRLLGAEPRVNLDVGNISETRHGLPTALGKTARRIQYEVAKIEILEMICSIAPNSETEAARNMIFTLRKSLYDACETCLESAGGEATTSVTNLKNIVSSVSCFLKQMANNCALDEPDTLFIREMLVGIVSNLTSLNTDLSNHQKRLSRKFVNAESLDMELEIARL